MRNAKEIFDSEIRDGAANGACVLAGRPGKEPGFLLETGFADCAKKFPMKRNTVIDIASCTKTAATVTSLLIAHSRGLVDFNAPFTEYLPDYTGKPEHTVSVRDLANHRSGFINVPGESVRRYFDESGLKILEKVRMLPPPAAPTKHAEYACWNYILLCMILEHVTGKSLPEFARENIFLPLGMASSSVGRVLPEISEQRLAQTTETDKAGIISDFVAYRIYRDGGTTGNAGMFSTADDLAKLLSCYLRHGETPSGQRLFDEKTFAEITPDKADHTDGYRRFGWVIYDKYLCEEAFGHSLLHSGWSGQTIHMDFERDFYTVVLTTRQGNFYDRCKEERFEVISNFYRKKLL